MNRAPALELLRRADKLRRPLIRRFGGTQRTSVEFGIDPNALAGRLKRSGADIRRRMSAPAFGLEPTYERQFPV